MEIKQNGALLIGGRPVRIRAVSSGFVMLETGRWISEMEARTYRYSPPAEDGRALRTLPRQGRLL